MKASPIGSKILSGYAVLFAGVLPAVMGVLALCYGMGLIFAQNVILGGAIAYFAVRVFLGDRRALKPFAVLVVIHYFGVTLSNIWNYDSFPVDSRAYQMAVPRMVRGVLFGSFYAWYFLLRRKTKEGFESQ